MSVSVTATGSKRQTEMEAELAWLPTWLRAVGTPPVGTPPWLPSLLPAVPPRLQTPFPLTLGTQPEKHQAETRAGPVTNQIKQRRERPFNVSSPYQVGH